MIDKTQEIGIEEKSPEEKFLEALEESEDFDIEIVDDDIDSLIEVPTNNKLHKQRMQMTYDFLGSHKLYSYSIEKPEYYGGLLIWALKNHIENSKWEITYITGGHFSSPEYMLVDVDYNKTEDCLCDGYLFLERNEKRLVVNVNAGHSKQKKMLLIQSNDDTVAKEFWQSIKTLAKPRTLYCGKNIKYSYDCIDFVISDPQEWDDLILDEKLKKEIYVNTIDFINRKDELSKYDIPARRGIILAGEPGTGKTLICKIIMHHGENITCIVADSSYMLEFEYIRNLYRIARDLTPSIVFIEDIDFVGESRLRFKSSAINKLLEILDGIESSAEVITIATTNYLDSLDNALYRRPRRFDRIFEINLPDEKQRSQLIAKLANKIPIPEEIHKYLVARTEGCTPALIQEIVHSVVIEHCHNERCRQNGICHFTMSDAENAIKAVRHERRTNEIGFLSKYK